nr:HlyD family efflux transporter periplasmic adaptor subunit [uncultured Tolumonas sp.]
MISYQELVRTFLSSNEFLAHPVIATQSLTHDELKAFVDFLQGNSLTLAQDASATKRLLMQYEKSQHGWLIWLIHNYLFFRIPLLRPDAFLNAAFPHIKFLFQKKITTAIFFVGLIGVFLAARQWDSFVATFMHFFSWEGLLLYGLTLAAVKITHEFGHAFVAKRYGCRVSSMGVAFIVLSPILYTDTTDAWKLRSRYQRLDIVTAGIRVEIYLALISIFLWSFLPDGALRSMAFFIATTSCVTSLMINLSPFMRFDGYYAFSDWLGVENLQTRSFAMGRWYLRKLLFGFDDPAPEPVSFHRQKIFIAYAWFTWIYRFFLFCGIALLVYFFAFKMLGIVLFLIEIGGFIALPIFRELTSWWKMKSMLKWNRHVVTTLTVITLIVVGLLFPWQTTISLPAIIKAQNYTHIYSLEDAQVTAMHVKVGDSVNAGQQLISLNSDDIDHQINASQLNITTLQTKLAKIAGSRENLDMSLVLQKALMREQKIQAGLQLRKNQLSVISPFSGKIVDMRPIKSGQMISRNEPLISIVGNQGYEIVAFLPARDFDSIALKAHAVFIGNNGQKIPLSFRVTDISQMTIPSLPYPELGSDYNGPIAARQEKEQELIPEQAYYKITLLPDGSVKPQSLRTLGFVVIDGKPKSYLTRIWQSGAGIFIRESGF